MPSESFIKAIRACRICRDAPVAGPPLDHEPRPIIQWSETARICIASQAPGVRAHQSGLPFTDPSGVRLREWMAVSDTQFYDARQIAIVPMGLCFPGQDKHRADLPPRRECAPTWRQAIFEHLPQLELLLVIGQYAQKWHLETPFSHLGVNDTVARWQDIYHPGQAQRIMPLPHPSWHNNRWLRDNPWFASELLPILQQDIQQLMPASRQQD